MADIRSTAERLGRADLTKDLYNEHGRFSASTMQKRFGSWNKALLLCGIGVAKRVNIPESEFLADLRRVADDLGTTTVTKSQYRSHGRFSDETLRRAFSDWGNALEAAKLEPTGWKGHATEEALLQNLAQVWEHVGRQPKQKDFHPPISQFSSTTYTNRYGSWRKALERFVEVANSERTELQDMSPIDVPSKPAVKPADARHRTGRNPSWRLRHLVMKRDNFACRLCGASPAKNPSVTLHVDHIAPWSKGGETIAPNLQTCCEVCNIGKSDL